MADFSDFLSFLTSPQQQNVGTFNGQPITMAGDTPLQGLGQLFGGLYNLGTAQSDVGFGREAAGMADPWQSQRQQYQTSLNNYMGANAVDPTQATARTSNALSMLNNLLANPQSLTQMPGYQFGLNQALEGVNRGAGASGMLNSGNRLIALQDRGNAYAQGWENQIYNQLLGNVNANIAGDTLGLGAQNQGYGQLANLAGVNAGSPTAAASALLNGLQNRNQSIGSGIGGLAGGAGSLASVIQRMLSGGGGIGANGIDLGGGLSSNDVYGSGSGWGSDVLQGGGSGLGIDSDNFDLMTLDPFQVGGW